MLPHPGKKFICDMAENIDHFDTSNFETTHLSIPSKIIVF